MKILSLLNYRKYGPVAAAVFGLLALPVTSRADDKKDDDRKKRDDHAEKHVDHAEKKADHVVDHAKKDAEHMADHGDKRGAEKRVDHAEKKADHIVDHAEKKADHVDHVVHEDRKDAVRHEEVRRADMPRDRVDPPRDHRGPVVAVEKHHDPVVVEKHRAPVVVIHREHPEHIVHDTHVVEWRHHHPGWVLQEGNGWRGRGFYWGPPGVTFFAEAPGVNYYSSADEVPVEYESEVTTTETATTTAPDADTEIGVAVQKALTNQGYYKGGVDGQLGPMSQRAIKRYQSDHGMDPTGLVTDALLKSLGID